MPGRKGKGQVVTRTALAEHFGVSATSVDHWVRTGCPVVQRGAKGKPWQFNTVDVMDWRLDKVREEATGSAPADEQELRRRKLAAQTAQAELDLAKAKGEVAPLDQIERGVSRAFAEVKASIRNVPSRAARLLIGETDETRFKAVLLSELDQALEALADAHLVADEDLIDEVEE